MLSLSALSSNNGVTSECNNASRRTTDRGQFISQSTLPETVSRSTKPLLPDEKSTSIVFVILFWSKYKFEVRCIGLPSCQLGSYLNEFLPRILSSYFFNRNSIRNYHTHFSAFIRFSIVVCMGKSSWF